MSVPVSILLPVRNGLPHLSAALRSLERQTLRHFEVLIEDDGSTDGSVEVLQAWAAKDGRFRVATGPPKGIVAALNAAAARAQGELLVRMDADDISAPRRLEHLLAFFRAHPDVGMAGSRVRYFPRRRLRAGARHYEAWINGLLGYEEMLHERFVECPIAHPSLGLRRGVFEELGGYREGPFPEDYDLVLRALDCGVRLAKVPEVLLYWREDPGRLSRTDARYSPDSFFRLKMQFLVPLLQRQGRPIAIAGAGPHGKRLARHLAACGLAVHCFFEVHPRRVGQTVGGARVLGSSDLWRARSYFVLAAVGQRGGRERVRRILEAVGLDEGVDWLAVQ